MRNYLKTSETTTVNNYPYGRLQCKMVKSLDFKPGKGFRLSSQTTNPKTGRINNPKKSTYSPVKVLYIDEKNHTQYVSFHFNGDKEIINGCKFMYDNFDLFAANEIDFIYMHVLNMLKVTFAAKMTYCNSKFEDLEPLLMPAINQLKKGLKTIGLNGFNIVLDLAALEATEQKGFNPFIASKPVLITDMIKPSVKRALEQKTPRTEKTSFKEFVNVSGWHSTDNDNNRNMNHNQGENSKTPTFKA